jgi:hypothetical protein
MTAPLFLTTPNSAMVELVQLNIRGATLRLCYSVNDHYIWLSPDTPIHVCNMFGGGHIFEMCILIIRVSPPTIIQIAALQCMGMEVIWMYLIQVHYITRGVVCSGWGRIYSRCHGGRTRGLSSDWWSIVTFKCRIMSNEIQLRNCYVVDTCFICINTQSWYDVTWRNEPMSLCCWPFGVRFPMML